MTGRRKYNLDDLAAYISDRSTLSKADIVAILISLEEAIPYLLKSGYAVNLGSLGIFSVQAKAQTSSEKSKVTWRDFLKLNIRFRMGKALKLLLSDVNFKRTD